jgi:aminoglycoside phosphotransferase family enzyme/predicted kinase
MSGEAEPAKPGMAHSARLIDGLVRAGEFGHPVADIRVVETHISWILLTGTYAYKIKKPVDLGFLDFSTLQKRRFYCEEELRLNRRYAPDLYLEVVTISGPVEAPVMGGVATPVLEVAVRMRQFPANALLSRQLEERKVSVSDMAELGGGLAHLHERAPVATSDDEFGTFKAVLKPMEENFAVLERPCRGTDVEPLLRKLRDWTQIEGRRAEPLLADRRRNNRVRECHGDLHLANLVRWKNQFLPFDCLEFDRGLRWIDVMNEVAFLFMDTLRAGRTNLAYAFLNGYLAKSGDYPGLALLPFYLVYRALVRAKVQLLSAGTNSDSATALRSYLQLAARWMQPTSRPVLVITYGLSGSGKTVIGSELMTALPAIRLRSDVERKRLHGLAETDRSNSALDAGLYSTESGEKTYRRLAQLAGTGLQAGFNMIVDATFLQKTQRQRFAELARDTGSHFVILVCDAPHDVLAQRIAGREQAGGDASEANLAVLSRQIERCQPPAPDEKSSTLYLDTRTRWSGADIAALIGERCQTGEGP